MQAQGVDFISHQFAQGRIHHAVALQRSLTTKRLVNDMRFEMYTIVTADANFRTRQSFMDHLLYSCAIHRLCILVSEIIGFDPPSCTMRVKLRRPVIIMETELITKNICHHWCNLRVDEKLFT